MPRPFSLAERRFLSREGCQALAERMFAMAEGGGETILNIRSAWSGNVRWGRNAINTGGDIEDTTIMLTRMVRGARGLSQANAVDDAVLHAAMREAEAMTLWQDQAADQYPVAYADPPQVVHPHSEPRIWFDATYDTTADARARVLEPIVAEAAKHGLLTTGYLECGAEGASVARNAPNPVFRYYPYTTAQFSLTVRDAKQGASGWAGVDMNEWSRIDTAALGHRAIEKCLGSRNPVAIEPGRYTAILEPQAVCDLFAPIMDSLDRQTAEMGQGPFTAGGGMSRIGERVLDGRLTVSADPMDPECGFVPFDSSGEPYRRVNWIENGVLTALSYSRNYAISRLQNDWALPNSSACRISGGATSLDEMIASTTRGVLVTRLSGIVVLDSNTLLLHGETRDGLWLIERGTIAKAIKNFRITESPLFAFNNVEQIGTPQRVFHPRVPMICPPIKVRDFSFTGLMDAV